jgi:ElaB/YqjD/DUF883 family membrane-anchored ribosome-binding protein
VTFDEFIKARGRGAMSELHLATGIAYDTLRKVRNRVPVRRDTAYALAKALGCTEDELVHPKPRRKRVRA